jgi:hypothetical protein
MQELLEYSICSKYSIFFLRNLFLKFTIGETLLQQFLIGAIFILKVFFS